MLRFYRSLFNSLNDKYVTNTEFIYWFLNLKMHKWSKIQDRNAWSVLFFKFIHWKGEEKHVH